MLGFLETAMNKVAAEASREGRAPTGRDLLQYLNNRSYFPDTWGKIESGKIKGGALTDDLIGAIGAGSNTTGMSTGNSSAKSPGSRFGGNPTNATIGNEHYGVENYGHHAAWYNAMGAPEAGRGIGSDYAVAPWDAPATAVSPAPTMPMRGLAKGGRVDKDEPVVVGEEGPEFSFRISRARCCTCRSREKARMSIAGPRCRPRNLRPRGARGAGSRSQPDGHDRQRTIAAQCRQLAANAHRSKPDPARALAHG